MALYIGVYAYAIIVHARADQLLTQLLTEKIDTLPIQCRHIEHMHKGIWFYANLDNFSLIRLLYMNR